MTCATVVERDVIDRYVHGRLEPDEQEAFEEHILLCGRCFDELQDYRMLRAELQRAPKRSRARPALAWSLPVWAGAAATVTLAVSAGFWLWPGATAPGPEPSTAAIPPVVPDPSIDETPSTPARTELIAQLARFEPPAYLPVTLRGVETTASVQTAAAMERYRAGDFAEAAEGLRGVLAAGPPTPAAAFYLGICELQAGRAPEAASLFHRALAIDDGIFEEDAKFFLSKALLLQDDVGGAAATLKEVVALAGDREAEARNLLEAIGRLPRS